MGRKNEVKVNGRIGEKLRTSVCTIIKHDLVENSSTEVYPNDVIGILLLQWRMMDRVKLYKINNFLYKFVYYEATGQPLFQFEIFLNGDNHRISVSEKSSILECDGCQEFSIIKKVIVGNFKMSLCQKCMDELGNGLSRGKINND